MRVFDWPLQFCMICVCSSAAMHTARSEQIKFDAQTQTSTSITCITRSMPLRIVSCSTMRLTTRVGWRSRYPKKLPGNTRTPDSAIRVAIDSSSHQPGSRKHALQPPSTRSSRHLTPILFDISRIMARFVRHRSKHGKENPPRRASSDGAMRCTQPETLSVESVI